MVSSPPLPCWSDNSNGVYVGGSRGGERLNNRSFQNSSISRPSFSWKLNPEEVTLSHSYLFLLDINSWALVLIPSFGGRSLREPAREAHWCRALSTIALYFSTTDELQPCNAKPLLGRYFTVARFSSLREMLTFRKGFSIYSQTCHRWEYTTASKALENWHAHVSQVHTFAGNLKALKEEVESEQ